jgi:hypothetical protein
MMSDNHTQMGDNHTPIEVTLSIHSSVMGVTITPRTDEESSKDEE